MRNGFQMLWNNTHDPTTIWKIEYSRLSKGLQFWSQDASLKWNPIVYIVPYFRPGLHLKWNPIRLYSRSAFEMAPNIVH